MARIPELVEQLGQGRVHVSHFPGVEVALELGPVGLGGLVGLVGVKDMDPQEPGLGLVLEPGHGRVHYRPGLPLNELEIQGGSGPVAVVIDVESLVEPEPRVERKGAHESAGGVSVLP